MLRIRTSLGQYSAPYQQTIAKIANGFPTCFTAGSILNGLDRAIGDGRMLLDQALNRVSWFQKLTTGATDNFKSEMGGAIQKAQTLRNRYASEPADKQYCVGSPEHFPTIQAITGIYQAAAGIEGYQATLDAAVNQLLYDLNPINSIPAIPGLPGSPLAQWATIAGVVAAVYLISQRRKTIVVQQEASQ